ncbi:hypothetical protein GXB85_03510 [Cellulomonas sp. APG4]|uniref:hypothetical protein n=1 Tax=Cellulomonas sp. APG4 TaxID=1538656 RepID=UPI001379BB9E|nr:hypothetical protein [Cellulomonas sp. APG4]NCT90024.1 hypothetical protein [Cellulomonas sp. APG4]
MAARPHDAADPPDEPDRSPRDDDGEVTPAEHPDEPRDGTADPDDVDRRWAEIVAQLGDLGAADDLPQDPAPPRRPRLPGAARPERDGGRRATGDAGPPRAAGQGHDGRTTGGTRPDGDEQGLPGPAVGPRAWSPDPAVEEAEDHFVPPDPGPVLGGDPLLTLAWVAVVAVPALLLVTVLAWRDVPALVLQLAGAAFVLALGLLVWRMPARRDDDDHGPGAVV